MKMIFSFYKQLDSMDCGLTCLRIIARHFGRAISLQSIKEKKPIGKEGVNLLGISDAVESVWVKEPGTLTRADYSKLNF